MTTFAEWIARAFRKAPRQAAPKDWGDLQRSGSLPMTGDVTEPPLVEGRVLGASLQLGASPSQTTVTIEWLPHTGGSGQRFRMNFGNAMFLQRMLGQMHREANFQGPPGS